ncbi:hypothetical protein STEG23_035321, partial [Scotinomys teguina]
MARKVEQEKEEEESRARQQEEKTPVREEEKKPACHGGGHDVVEQGPTDLNQYRLCGLRFRTIRGSWWAHRNTPDLLPEFLKLWKWRWGGKNHDKKE